MKIIFGLKSAQLAGSSDWDYAETHPLGGAETALLRMASTFRDSGHDVEIVYYPPVAEELRLLMAGKSCDIFINSRVIPAPSCSCPRRPEK